MALRLNVVLICRLAEQAGGLFHITRNTDTPGIMPAQGTLSIWLPLSSSLAVPLNGTVTTFGHSFTALITITQIKLGKSKPLLGRFLEPLHSLYGIGGSSLTIAQAITEAVLSFCMPLLGSHTVPLSSQGVILEHTPPFIIAGSKRKLGLCISSHGSPTLGRTTAHQRRSQQKQSRSGQARGERGDFHAAARSLAAFRAGGKRILWRTQTNQRTITG